MKFWSQNRIVSQKTVKQFVHSNYQQISDGKNKKTMEKLELSGMGGCKNIMMFF